MEYQLLDRLTKPDWIKCKTLTIAFLLMLSFYTDLELMGQNIVICDEETNLIIPFVYYKTSKESGNLGESAIIPYNNFDSLYLYRIGYKPKWVTQTAANRKDTIYLTPLVKLLDEITVEPYKITKKESSKRAKRYFRYFPLTENIELISHFTVMDGRTINNIKSMAVIVECIKKERRQSIKDSLVLKINIYNNNKILLYTSSPYYMEKQCYYEIKFNPKKLDILKNTKSLYIGIEILKVPYPNSHGVATSAKNAKNTIITSFLRTTSSKNEPFQLLNYFLNKSYKQLGYNKVNRNFNWQIEYEQY